MEIISYKLTKST